MNRAERSRLAEHARFMRRNMTAAEKKLWYQFLCDYPIRFSSQIIVGPYIVDFLSRKIKLSIELDGSQHYEESQRKYDEVRTTYLEMEGIKELRFPTRTFGIISKVFANAYTKKCKREETIYGPYLCS